VIQEKVEIISNKVVGEGYYRMALRSHRIVKAARPGQFLHIRVGPGHEPLLRRPISIHSLDDKETFSILYEVAGSGTARLADKKSGQDIDAIGPAGRGFSNLDGKKRLIMAGGGIGVAPLLFAAQEGLRRKIEVSILIGARSKDRLLCVSDFKTIGCAVETITDDGSSGREGYVTDLIEEAIISRGSGPALVLACGPKLMMRRAAITASLYDVPCQVSLEESMACGIGTCLGCAVMTTEGYKRVCAEGPVFSAEEIAWED
jgi:dihydroorotate dehydrogenase electron transfer subunit